MNDREELVKAIMMRTSQPTIEDAVSLMKWEKLKNVGTLLELYDKLRAAWADKRLG